MMIKLQVWVLIFIGGINMLSAQSCDDCHLKIICHKNPQEQLLLQKQIKKNLEILKSTYLRKMAQDRDDDNLGSLGPFNGPSIQGNLIWPLATTGSLNDFSYYHISQYFDLDSVSQGSLLDYNCGTRTYDLDSGYDHDGIDIVTYPFPYEKMSASQVNVVAAADGIILCKFGGTRPDDNCRTGTGRPSNTIILVHADGTMTRYAHLKSGSFTFKNELEAVSAGEYLGQVGSSGNSSVPHLHFEIQDQNFNTLDPFFGPCSDQTNQLVETTSDWFAEPMPYEQPNINALITHHSMPSFRSCDLSDSTAIPGIMNAKNYFEPSDSIIFGTYYRHPRGNMSGSVKILRPDNTIWRTWNETFPDGFTKIVRKVTSEKLPFNAMEGRWVFQVDFDGNIYKKEFFVASCPGFKSLMGIVNNVYFNKAQVQLVTTQTIINNGLSEVIYQAGNSIEFNPGFELYLGAKLETRLSGCDETPDE